MANLLEWEKRLKQAVAQQHKIGWSVREKRGKCLIQRYWKDTGTYERKVIPVEWESDQLLNILNSLNKISELMVNTKCTLAEAVKVIFPENKIVKIKYRIVRRLLSSLNRLKFDHFNQ